MKTLTLEQLREFDSTAGADIVYHGTSSSYSEQIESRGWPLDGHPFDWANVDFVCEMAVRFNIYGEWWVGSDLARKNRGASFTGRLATAIRYAESCPGGESLHSTIEGARKISSHLRIKGENHSECDRLEKLVAEWQPHVDHSTPVVYAVCGTPDFFPEMFRYYHYLAQGKDGIDVDDLILEVVAKCDVPAHAIVSRTSLTKPQPIPSLHAL